MNMLELMNLLYKHHIRMYIEPDEFKLGYMQVTFRIPHQGFRKMIDLKAFNSISGGSGDSILMDVIAGDLRRFIDDIIKELELTSELTKRAIKDAEYAKVMAEKEEFMRRHREFVDSLEDGLGDRAKVSLGTATDA